MLGILIALGRGFAGDGFTDTLAAQPFRSALEVIGDGLRLLGQATIPISLIVTGAQIAAATMVQNRPAKALTGILLNRLALAPVLCIAMLWGFDYLLPVLSDAQLCVIAIVLVMPVSVTSTVITETMNQDTSLAAQAVLYTTLASILTVPAMFVLARAVLAG